MGDVRGQAAVEVCPSARWPLDSYAWQVGELLVHKSQVNRTLVNGVEVADRKTLSGGDEIQFADRVTRSVALESGTAAAGASAPTGSSVFGR